MADLSDEEFLGTAQKKELSDAEFLAPVPSTQASVVQPSQTKPSQSREAIRPTISIPNLTESIFGPTAGQIVRNAQAGAIAAAKAFVPTTLKQAAEFATPSLPAI